MAAAAFMLALASCGGSNQSQSQETNAVDDETFYATQPLVSGLYGADRYDIAGEDARKGKFDGRVLVALSPETSALYVYENGNRAKIDYMVALKAPFEKGDSGVYTAVDVNNLPVTISADSASYVLSFEKNQKKVQIGFDQKPTSTGTALEIVERINAQRQKNKEK